MAKDETKNIEIQKNTNLKLSIWRIFAYFIIYSIAGYIIETIFGLVTKGVLESRQSFLYGPFCAIYGLGATIMIIFLHKYSKRYNILFFGGFLLGSVIEYLVSWIGEVIFQIKWWDYSTMPLNINGRICVYFSFFWGFLAIYLIASLNPKVDRFFDWIKTKISIKTLKVIILSVILFLFIDFIASSIADSLFLMRMIARNEINVKNKEEIVKQYDKIYGNEKLANFIYKFWGDEKMIKTFPNLKVQDVDGKIIYMDSFLDIQPYYIKVHEPRNLEIPNFQSNN